MLNHYIQPNLSKMLPSIHGARDHRELACMGLDPNSIIDFSANSNPYGPHPAVLDAVRQALTKSTFIHYPDRHCLALTEAIAIAEDVPLDYILPTNGASELIQLIALAFVEPGSRHLILAPTFGEYERAIQLMDGAIKEYRPQYGNLHFKPDAVTEVIRSYQPDAVWLCNPNNPTGQHWHVDDLATLRTADPQNRILWIIDESYRYFSHQKSVVRSQKSVVGSQKSEVSKQQAVDSRQQIVGSSQKSVVSGRLSTNMITIRSLTKEHGLAGLRLGYAVAPPNFIEALRTVQPPWSVNSLAQVAGVAALQPEVIAWRDESLARLHHHAEQLWAELSALGYPVLPSSTPYTLVEVGDAPTFRQKLLIQGLLVRDCTSFGLPEHIRIAAQLPEDNEKLLIAIRQISMRWQIERG